MGRVIAIDGVSGSGKGTIASKIAKELGFYYLESGSLYRLISYLIIQNNINLNDIDAICNLFDNNEITIKDNKFYVNGENYTEYLRNDEIDMIATIIADIKDLRLIINNKIIDYIGEKDIVIDGRDVGSNIVPNAFIKFYLDCSVDIRARRRFEQYSLMGLDADYKKILENLKVRDKIDTTRTYGALIKTNDAILIDTSNDEIDVVINKMLNIIRRKL